MRLPKKPKESAAKRAGRATATPVLKPIRTTLAPLAKRASLKKPSAAARDTYRHGDLRRALLEAGVDLARAGGPDAIVLREATRRTGVVPNAAYRHFANRDDLLQAVGDVGLSMLAQAMETEMARVKKGTDAVEEACARFKAVGRGYLRFAVTEPGLFRTAFATAAPEKPAPERRAGSSGLSPFQLLSSTLDRMAELGVLSAERRRGAEFLAWAAVHGMALLQLDGPLRAMDKSMTEALGERLLEMVDKGVQ